MQAAESCRVHTRWPDANLTRPEPNLKEYVAARLCNVSTLEHGISIGSRGSRWGWLHFDAAAKAVCTEQCGTMLNRFGWVSTLYVGHVYWDQGVGASGPFLAYV